MVFLNFVIFLHLVICLGWQNSYREESEDVPYVSSVNWWESGAETLRRLGTLAMVVGAFGGSVMFIDAFIHPLREPSANTVTQ